jgi:hypothetical protein
MSQPITVDIPHKLGRTAARQRLADGVGQLTSMIPGSAITANRWDGDVLTFNLEALGQRIAARIEVFDDHVRATLDLPAFLGFMADKVCTALAGTGRKLLQ